MNEMIDFKSVGEIFNRKIDTRTPFSFVRLGDGEGALANFSRESTLEDYVYFQSHFGKLITASDIENIRMNLERTIASADLIGVRDDILNARTGSEMLDPKASDFFENFKENFSLRESERNSIDPHGAKRIFQSFLRMRRGFPPQSDICSQWVCYDLASERFWEALFERIRTISLITSSQLIAERLRRRFGLEVKSYVVPGQEAEISDSNALRHYPKVYADIVQRIRFSARGRVFLIGAGLVGKHYLDLVKRNGGIALDIGALFDAWDGRPSRGLIYSSKVPLEESRFVAPPQFRLGPGLLGGNAEIEEKPPEIGARRFLTRLWPFRSAISGKMRPRLVLHIGFSKTATTSLQSMMADNPEALKRGGTNYVRAARGTDINHHAFARALGIGEDGSNPDFNELARFRREIDEEISSRPEFTHIMSTELLTNTSPCNAAEDDLIDFLLRYDVKLVVFVRNQFDWLKSWYGQAAKNGNMDRSFSDFLDYPIAEKFDGNFVRKINWFKRYLGTGVEVLSYDDHHDVIHATFAKAVGLSDDWSGFRYENAAVSSGQIFSRVAERRLALPKEALKGVEWPGGVPENFLMENLTENERKAVRAEVMRRYALSNRALFDEYGIALE